MKIEIWSDVLCPFCYIGKRNFESALNQFTEKDKIEIEWKSFQLNPALSEFPSESYEEYLINAKGLPKHQVQAMLDNVTQMAQKVGLNYDFENAVMVNSFKAHRLIQFAKTKNAGNQAEEQLFKAFFTEGENIAEEATLKNIGTEIGLSEAEVDQALNENKYADLVESDMQLARDFQISSVPFFVFDRKYAVSGAQAVSVFLQTMEKSFSKWKEEHKTTSMDIIEGAKCSVDGICEE